jgi:short-subunit dehydrogenase
MRPDPALRLRGARVLVTGASSGIGRAAAERFAAAGAALVLHGRDLAALEALAGRTGGRVVCADLAEPGAAARVAEAAGPVDVLVCNAGIGWAGPFTRMDAATVAELVAVNLAAPIELTRLLLPPMVARGRGRVVLVGSIAGRLGVAGEAVYAATKAGLEVFAESLRLELRGTGVAVTVLVPGIVDTAFFARRGTPYPRGGPRPVSAETAAEVLVRASAAGTAEAYVPRWLRLPVAVRGVVPGVYRNLAGRFGPRL